jgi:site-specific recombinase XerD
MELAPVFDEFVAYLDLELNRSLATIGSYTSDFRQFVLCLAEARREASVEAVDRQAVRGYIAWLRQQGLSPTTVCRRIASLRSFWRYVRDAGYTERDPFVRVSVPKRAKHLPVCLNAEETEALLQAAGRQTSVLKAFRDTAVLTVLVFTGLRRAELLGLRLRDIDLREGTLRVEHGKGDKTRVVPLGQRALLVLRDWLELRPECNHDFVFPSNDRRRLAPKGLAGLLRRALSRAGLNRPGTTAHSLRHTCATLLLRGGCDLHSVQRVLGHRDPATTAIYLSLTLADLHRAVARHPLAGEEAHGLAHPVGVGVNVDVGRLDGVMPHEVADGRQVHAPLREARAETVPQRVQRETSVGQAGSLTPTAEHGEKDLLSDGLPFVLAPLLQEERVGVRVRSSR